MVSVFPISRTGSKILKDWNACYRYLRAHAWIFCSLVLFKVNSQGQVVVFFCMPGSTVTFCLFGYNCARQQGVITKHLLCKYIRSKYCGS